MFSTYGKQIVCLHAIRLILPKCRPRHPDVTVLKRIYCNSVAGNTKFVKEDHKFVKNYENTCSHNVLELCQNCRQLLFPHPLLILSDRKKSEAFLKYFPIGNAENSNTFINQFHELSVVNTTDRQNFEDVKVRTLVSSIVKSLQSMTDSEIEMLLFDLCLWPRTRLTVSQNFRYFAGSLDKECCHRLSEWEIDRQLRVADYFYHLSLSRILAYNSNFIQKFYRKLNTLTSHELLQLCFFITLQRNVSLAIMESIEDRIHASFTDYSIMELGIVCLAFYKTKTRMQNRLLISELYRILIKNLSNVSNVTLVAFLKQLYYSSRYEHQASMEALLTASVPYLNRWNVNALVRFCLLGSDLGVYNPEVLDEANNQILLNIENIRLKELTKVFFAICHYGYRLKNEATFVETVIRELRSRKSDVDKFPECLITSLIGLSYLNVYPKDLLKTLFSKDSVWDFKKWNAFSNDIMILDCCIEIECPWYNGPRVDINCRMDKLKERFNRIPSRNDSSRLTFQDYLLLDVFEMVQDVICPHSCKLMHVLPHYFRPDIVFCTDKAGLITDIPGTWSHSKSGFLYPLGRKHFHVILVRGLIKMEQYKPNLTGHLQRKFRQLKLLGYRVLVFSVSEFAELNSATRRPLIKKQLEILLK